MRKEAQGTKNKEFKRIREIYDRSRKQAIEPQDTPNHEYQRRKSVKEKNNLRKHF